MAAVIIVVIIIWAVMWGFYKFMYPRPPKTMMPQKGDVITPRACDFCGHQLAEYRGVLESQSALPESQSESELQASHPHDTDTISGNKGDLFFCNYEHQADFHAGKK